MKNSTKRNDGPEIVTYAGGFEARFLRLFGSPSYVLSRGGEYLRFANPTQARATMAQFEEANPGLAGFVRDTARPFYVVVLPPAE